MDGEINGRPVHLAFDTGAEGTALFRKSAARLGLKVIKLRLKEPLEAGQVAADETEDCTFSYGGGTQRGKFAVVDSPNLPLDVDGVVSWTDLSNQIISIDFERRALVSDDYRCRIRFTPEPVPKPARCMGRA
jgi:hypothetical protein